MNIFVRELKASFRSLVVWAVVVILLTVTGVAKFSAYYNNTQMLEMLKVIPAAMASALELSAFNLTTLNGFFGIMYTYFALLLCIAAAMWGSDIISKEERDRTIEFSLTLPVTRRQVVVAKTLAALVNCIVLLLITWVFSLISATPYKPDSTFYSFLALEMVAVFILQLVFLAIGILLGCAMKRYKQSSTTAVAILLVTYFISIIAGLSANLDFLKYFSPFKYFDPAVMLHEGSIDLGFVLLSAVIVVVCMIGALLSYQRRDLYI